MKKSKYITNIVVVTVLLLTSIAMYLLYPSMEKAVQNNKDMTYQISNFASTRIPYYHYYIDREFKRLDNQSTDITQYLKKVGTVYESNDILNHFNNRLNDSSDFFTQKDIFYTAVNTKTEKVQSNTTDDLSKINTDKELQKKYQLYIQYQFDTNGVMKVSFATNYGEFLRAGEGQDYNSDFYYSYENGAEYIANPTNLTITYAVPTNIEKTGDLSSYLSMTDYTQFIGASMLYILLASAILFIIILITPLHYLEKVRLYKEFSRIKFEILSILWCTAIFFILKFLTMGLIPTTLSGQFANFLKDYQLPELSNFIIHATNIGIWMILFFLITFFFYMIKYLFKKGFKGYFFDNTCLGWIITNGQKIMNKVINFDLNDNINKSVLKIVLFNFVIISIVSVFFVFGIFFAFMYSIIIFVLLKKKFEEIKRDYEVLLNATRKLSEGNFDAEINEDVGIFNPLKDEFSHIQDGFEKAVKEEVKSQKMKTELISNVSHDLKTPLTSIITYVDLLKNDQLTQEQRDQYIQILDRNSLRLKNLIDDLFEVSKANSGNIKLDIVEVDIVALIKQAKLECQDKLDEMNLDVRMNFSQDKITTYLDSSKTYRIFENLFINVSKYALTNTRVYIDVQQQDNKISIIFRNISKDEMKFNKNEIVERFVQGDQSRNTTGSGLGLAIVKSFTEIQNGRFYVEIDGDLFKSIIEFEK